MTRGKLLLAFSVGFMTAVGLGLTDMAGASNASVNSSLEDRLTELEQQASRGYLGQTVRTPFEVVDGSGKRIFYVNQGVVDLFNGNEDDVARIEASGGGRFVATSGDGSTTATLGAPAPGSESQPAPSSGSQSDEETSALSFGLAITDSGKSAVVLGKRPAGNYSLIFNKGSQMVAAIGETQEGSGQATVAFGGVPKVGINVSKAGKGQVIVTRDGNILASLGEGSYGGGLMFLCKPGSCDPPMVSAGLNGDNRAVVATAPRAYIQGPTGAPGSYLISKR